MSCEKDEVGVVIVPFPAQGHLNKLINLSRLIASYGLPVHYAGSSKHNRMLKLRLQDYQLEESSGKIYYHDFELPPYTVPPIDISCEYSKVVVIHDSLMTSVVQDVKHIPNAKSYNFVPISAFCMFFNFWNSQLEKPFQLDSDDISLCKMPSTESCLTPEFAAYIANQLMHLGSKSGWVFNSSRMIEGRYVNQLEKYGKIKHFGIGPFIVSPKPEHGLKLNHRCLEWLDQLEGECPAIYVSFGTNIGMMDDQVRELALGLERNGFKFIWVLRIPDELQLEGEVKGPQLPEGYEERVKNQGIVVRDWAPQVEILSHPSIGGFISHCGWNSCLESMTMGVPIVAWPMHSDQPKNSILVTEVLRIGILVRDWADRDKLVTSIIIENTLRRLAASEGGQEIRKRAKELGIGIRGSVSENGC